MFINVWNRCKEHKLMYPPGSMCPACQSNFDKREEVALLDHWKDVIPLKNQLDFMRNEHVYCRDEEYDFQSYDGSDRNEKERLRIIVLEKRAEFLRWYITIIEQET